MPPHRCCYCVRQLRTNEKHYIASPEDLVHATTYRASLGKQARVGAVHICGTHARRRPITETKDATVVFADENNTSDEVSRLGWNMGSLEVWQQTRPDVILWLS